METYAPTASLMSLRLLLATTCLQPWKVCSFDVSGAYLYSPVEETVLMEPPTHFIPSLKGKVLHLQKALYGMKQAGCLGLECAIGEGEVTISQTRLTNAYPRKIFQHDSPLPPISKMHLDEKEAFMEATPFRLAFNGANRDPLDHVGPSCGVSTQDLGKRHCPTPTGLLSQPVEWQAGVISTVVALSTCATEYIALSNLTQNLVQAINQLTQLAQDFKKMIFCDNQAAVQVSIDNFSRKRMQYLNHAFFFVNDVICKHGVVVKWVTTQEMQADALTKRLSGQSLTQALQFLNVTGNR
ncbi:hypothetical protein O181_027257 [Austropuccinia psidii MF-1]|uniref:Reverse transcriptase Ty1/copia-type domain-containing protein n=1 Tax=Austropuccinia psidii MF-1 TaxID=1389203 RepID=A0A9Q3H1I6_9BASI|nr:hypothetical protein [Austropuccinia psidii MF-1]